MYFSWRWRSYFEPLYIHERAYIISIYSKRNKSETHFFSTDPLLSAENMVHYYSLRFQIEFDFRDAKQLFGLHKLKNFYPAQMINMFHLAFLALQCAKIWQKYWATKLNSPKNSLLDMKAIFKAQWNLKNAIKLAENDPNLFFNPEFIPNFVPEDMINVA